MKITLCIDKQNRGSPSEELKEYVIDIGCPLRSIGDVFDELKISTDDNNVLVGQIIRRCYVDKYGVLKELEQEEIQELDVPDIELFEGTNYVYIKEFTNLNMKLEYLTNAEMNKYFATKMEMNSSIKQTADSINLEVSKKVGEDEIISKINMSPEEIQILANKLGLTANDVINIIAGSEINLTSKNISITSDNFSVDKDGHLTCVGADFQGGNINTDKNAYIGDNLYVGANQESLASYAKLIAFSNTVRLMRSVSGDTGESLYIFAPYLEAQAQEEFRVRISDNISAYDTFVTNADLFSLSANNYQTSINGNSDGIYMTHNPIISSDKRLKKKIQNVDVSWIRNLKIREFEYKSTPGKKQIGLIAQDYLDKDFSKYFLNKNVEGYYSINYGNITNALIKYCQQLESRISELEKKVNTNE